MTARLRVDPAVGLYRHARLFYAFAIALPWLLWFAAAHLSHLEPQTFGLRLATTVLGLLGLFAPAVVAWALIRRDPRLVADARARLTLRGIRLPYALLALVLLPATLVVAILISLALGGSLGQLALKPVLTGAIGLVPGWLTISLAPLAEELAWHSYGTDALTRRWTLWRTTWVFSIFWALWHIPLMRIAGSYQADVAETSALVTVNFLVSVLPFVIVMNWLYHRCGRNIWIAVLVHLAANVGNEVIAATPETKIYQTLVLVPICGVILWRERALFFAPNRPAVSAAAAGAGR